MESETERVGSISNKLADNEVICGAIDIRTTSLTSRPIAFALCLWLFGCSVPKSTPQPAVAPKRLVLNLPRNPHAVQQSMASAVIPPNTNFFKLTFAFPILHSVLQTNAELPADMYLWSLESSSNLIQWAVVTNFPRGFTNTVWVTNRFEPGKFFRMHGRL